MVSSIPAGCAGFVAVDLDHPKSPPDALPFSRERIGGTFGKYTPTAIICKESPLIFALLHF
jgi:hypothetical protein